MKKFKFILLMLASLLFIGCGAAKPEPVARIKCWEKVYSAAPDLAFVVAVVNVCNGPKGGTVETTVIQPIKDYLDRMEKKADRFRREALAKKAFKGGA